MTIKVVAAPDEGLVSLADAKLYIGVPDDTEDALLGTLIGAASNYLDGPAGILHRSIREWTYEIELDCFPRSGESIEIPLSPLQSVVAFTYRDTAEAEQTVPTANYEHRILNGLSYLSPKGEGWPESHADHRIVLRYKGYNGSESGGVVTVDVPQEVQVACKMICHNMYDHRDTLVRGQYVPNRTLSQILASHRLGF